MLSYGCTRLEIGVQSVYEDVARDTNRQGMHKNIKSMLSCKSQTVTTMCPEHSMLPLTTKVMCPATSCICLIFFSNSFLRWHDVVEWHDTFFTGFFNRGHTVAAVTECFNLAKDSGYKVDEQHQPERALLFTLRLCIFHLRLWRT